jgi:ligand-binding SRPBCC domain-containing protein
MSAADVGIVISLVRNRGLLIVAHIRLQTDIKAPTEQVFDLAQDIDLHQRSMAHTNERAIGGRTSGLIGLGETVTWRARHLGLTWSLTSKITAFEPPTRFVDEQISGPFAWFRHEHRFDAIPGGTRMVDDWQHAAPFGIIGTIADRLVLDRLIRRLLARRNTALANEAEEAAAATVEIV